MTGIRGERASEARAQKHRMRPWEIRDKLNKVLSDRNTLRRSAAATFRQFDEDRSGKLDFNEVRRLIDVLCKRLELPDVDDFTLKRVIAKYDDGDQLLSLEEFEHLYWDLLLRVREKYYPNKVVQVRRDFFVGRRNLKSEKIQDLFNFEAKLGAGQFGEVHRVKERATGNVRVCKTVNKDRAALPVEQIDTEIDIMKVLDHPNVIKVYEVYEDFHNVYIIMEHCTGGELTKVISSGKRLTEKDIAIIMKQVLSGLAYCHEMKVVHKDLKPDNIMFATPDENASVKIIDFGVGEIFARRDDHSTRAAGTPFYMAPEVFEKEFSLECDIWSAGVIMFFLLTGDVPFKAQTYKELEQKVCFTEPDFMRAGAFLSRGALDLMKAMLVKDPRRRPSARECLSFKWFEAVRADVPELSLDIKYNLQNFSKQSSLKNSLVYMMAHQLPMTGARVKKIIELFKALDKDGNGILSEEELRSGLQAAGWKPCDINNIIQQLDIDESNYIQYTEFLAACYTWRESELNILWTTFNKMDEDGDGKISTQEFLSCLSGGLSSTNGGKLLGDEEEIRAMIREIDRNGDGYVQWDEFLLYMRGGA